MSALLLQKDSVSIQRANHFSLQSSRARRQRNLRDEDDEDDDYTQPSTSGTQREPKRIRQEDSSYNELDSQLTAEQTSQDLERKVNDTVRYALACEHRKQVIRKDDITRKVLTDRSRSFPAIFDKTQAKLRHIFGMELTELVTKEKSNPTKRAAANGKVQLSKTYVLRNILPEEQNDPQIIHHTDDEYQSTGLLYVILSLIFVNEQSMNDELLMSHLNRLRIPEESETFGDRARMLDGFVKQGYLQRQKLNADVAQGDQPVFQYSWGPRAKAEVPEQNMVGLISSVRKSTVVESCPNEHIVTCYIQ
ncbi:MAGE family-domain-containing protein [Umbelopsis sp. AD052]|nr:MAGE family-domain-containing protein [Umbelopsis sp. AD052]